MGRGTYRRFWFGILRATQCPMHSALNSVFVLFVTLVLCLVVDSSLGEFENGGRFKTKQLLLNYGEAHDAHSFIFEPDVASEHIYSAQVIGYNVEIITNVEVRTVDAGSAVRHGAVNVTCEFSFEASVGVSIYKLQIRTKDDAGTKRLYTMTGEYVIIGLVMYSDDGKIVSGENSQGITYSSYKDVIENGAKAVRVASQGPMGAGQQFEMSRLSITVHSLKGKHAAGVIDSSCVTVKDDSIEVLPKPYRVSDTPQVITVSHPDCVVDGEIFETVIIVSVPNSITPPPVCTGPQMINMTTGSAGTFDMRFYNLMSPPQKKVVASVTIMAGDSVIAESKYSQPNSDVPDESLHFKANVLSKAGVSTISALATFEDGTSVDAVMDEEVMLRVVGVDTAPSNVVGKGPSKVLIGVLTTVGAIVAVLIVVAALFVTYRQRQAESDESDFSRSGPSGVPQEFVDSGGEFVLRDRYARTESFVDEYAHNEPVEDGPEVTREEAASRQSSICEF